MTTDYKVILRDTAGVKRAVITDFLSVAYAKRIGKSGVAEVWLPGDHAAVSQIEHKWQVEVHRRSKRAGIDWYTDFEGLFLDEEHLYTDQSFFKISAAGYLWWLETRWVMWTASLADRTVFTADPGETIMKTLVEYNAAASATVANGREREGAIAGISVEADGGGGNTLDWYCSWKNLLKELQDLAQVAGGDFDLVKTGPATWEFRWYAGQRGDDLTGEVTFSLGRGNMENPKYRYNRLNEATVAVVAGRGVGAARDVSVVEGPDYAAANDVEVFVDARNTDSENGRVAAGERRLEMKRARDELSFDVLQVDSTLYGLHYCVDGVLGDLVSANYAERDFTQKIIGVSVSMVDGREKIAVEMETQ